MPRAATATISRSTKSKSASTTTTSRRPALKVVNGRKPATAVRPTLTRTTAIATASLPTAPASRTEAVAMALVTGTPVTYNKNDLLKRFAPLVRHVVERVAATLPRNVDHEDLYSAGVLGLLDAHA